MPFLAVTLVLVLLAIAAFASGDVFSPQDDAVSAPSADDISASPVWLRVGFAVVFVVSMALTFLYVQKN